MIVDLPEPDPVTVLSEWDRRRSAAWASGDPDRLAPLYVAGSSSGRVDRRMLASYDDRGLRVTGLRMELLSVEVRRSGPGSLRLVVTDRLSGGVVETGEGRLPLPRDGVSVRTVVLRVVDGLWRVAEVRDQPSPVATTASTSPSRNW
jgi:hypothetical protein